MITLDAPDLLGHTIFCDEIRGETSGKFTFIGVYQGMMHLPSFPCVIPRLGISITYSQRAGVFLAPIKFVIFLPSDPDDKPSVTAELPEQAAKEARERGEKMRSVALEPAHTYPTARLNLNVGMLPILKPGLLKVRAVRGDELFRLGTLLIEGPMPAQIPSPNASQQPS